MKERILWAHIYELTPGGQVYSDIYSTKERALDAQKFNEERRPEYLLLGIKRLHLGEEE